MSRRMKGKMSVILVLALIFGMMGPFSVKTFAASAKINVQDVSGKKGEEIDIPVNISGNTGLMGFVLDVSYDSDVLQMVSVTKGTLLSGQFDDNHETPGKIKVLWAGTENMGKDGELFRIKFKILDSVNVKETKVNFDYSRSDTFDGNFNDVELSCSPATVKIDSGETASQTGNEEPVADIGKNDKNNIFGVDKTVQTGENFEIPVSIKNNTGLMGFVFEIGFSVDKIKVNSVTAGEVIPSGTPFDYNLDTAASGKIKVLWAGTEAVQKDGVLFKINCTVLEKAALGNASISLGYSRSDTFDGTYQNVILNCKDISLTVISNGNEPSASPATDYESDGFRYEVNEDGSSVTIVKCTSNNADIVIPSKIGNYTVTEIGKEAFKGLTTMVSVQFPETILEIGENAYEGCSSLVSVKLPDSLTGLGIYAFKDCTSLTDITLNNQRQNVVKGLFMGCTNLASVGIPDTVIAFRESCFEGCQKLSVLSVPVSLQIIETNAFKDSGITSIVYAGNQSDWQKIKITTWGNEQLKKAYVMSKDLQMFAAIETSSTSVVNPFPNTTPVLQSQTLKIDGEEILYVGDSEYYLVNRPGWGTKTWKSSNTSVGTISNSGFFKAKKEGRTYLTVSVSADSKYKAASKGFWVTVKKRKGYIYVSSKIAVKKGKSVSLHAGGDGGKLTFKSSNTKIVTVSNKGVIKAKKKGKATITIKMKATKQYTSATAKVKVVVKK